MKGLRGPIVWEDPRTGGATLERGPCLDTPDWIAWLDAATTTHFSYPVYNSRRGYIEGFMTVRKERRTRGSHYWTAYWRVGGALRKAYVGRSPAVTTTRLRAISATWLAQLVPPPPTKAVG